MPETAERIRATGAEVIGGETLEESLRALRGKGIRTLMVEGGARIGGALLEARLVDRLIIFQAPVVLGRNALNAFAWAPTTRAGEARRLRVVERRAIGDDLMTTYALGSD
jgi:diaminohydroxyphosphoribosylaminopyrimidine deaminase/5-amino-6-(5-phosphoribosylamino)uracil reductase